MRRGAHLEELISAANEGISPSTKMLFIVGLQCDLTTRPSYMPNGGPGLLTMCKPPPYDRLVNLMSSWDYQWRTTSGLTVVWTLPYVIDFLLYNERRAKLLRHKELCDFHVYEAGWCAREMRESLGVLCRMLRERCLVVMELDKWEVEVTSSSGSDGLHLGIDVQKWLFSEVIQSCLERYPVPPPATVAIVKTSDERALLKQRRQRQRLRRRAAGRVKRLDVTENRQVN